MASCPRCTGLMFEDRQRFEQIPDETRCMNCGYTPGGSLVMAAADQGMMELRRQVQAKAMDLTRRRNMVQ